MEAVVRVITLTTDFGSRDWFVGTMKGVILRLAPKATVVDVTHDLPPGDIRAGAFALAAACRFFPKGTVHVAVIDPGVGSARRAIAARTANGFFVGPDNGVLSWALAREQIKAVHTLENADCFLHPVSRTFHGRDVFAPVAARLSRGMLLRQLGPVVKNFVRLSWPSARHGDGWLEGEVVYVDHFGNAITNLENRWVQDLASGPLAVWRGRKRLCPLADFYQSVPTGRPVAVPGSSGFLEVVVNGGNASQKLRLQIATALAVRPA